MKFRTYGLVATIFAVALSGFGDTLTLLLLFQWARRWRLL